MRHIIKKLISELISDNFSTCIFHLKFDFDFKDFLDENVRYMLVWIYFSLSELAIYDVKIFEYDKLESI